MNSNRLKGYLTEFGKTYAECANAIGVSVTAFSNKMNGISHFDIEEINRLIVFLNMPKSIAQEIFLP